MTASRKHHFDALLKWQVCLPTLFWVNKARHPNESLLNFPHYYSHYHSNATLGIFAPTSHEEPHSQLSYQTERAHLKQASPNTNKCGHMKSWLYLINEFFMPLHHNTGRPFFKNVLDVVVHSRSRKIWKCIFIGSDISLQWSGAFLKEHIEMQGL